MATKSKLPGSKEKTTANQVVGLNGNQLLKASNKDGDDTPMQLHISSALNKKAQEQVNQSSQRLCEKATATLKSQLESQTAYMEGIEEMHS